jgi:hypothetical protein
VPADHTEPDSALPQPPPSPASAEEVPRDGRLPEIAVYDDEVEWVYESDSEELPGPVVSDDKVLVPRRVLYLQGVLLGAVGLLCFILGLLARDSHTRDEFVEAGRPCVVTGQVTYAATGEPRPDSDSALVVLPLDRRPELDGRLPVEGLRPGDPAPLDENQSLRVIRSLGGAYTRTDESGQFRVQVPEAGTYYVLVISAHSQRSPQDQVATAHVAQLGRYFQSALDLLGDRKYRWSQLTIRRDRRLDIRF